MAELYELSAIEIAEGLEADEMSAADVADAFIARSEAVDPQITAYLNPTFDRTREEAKAADQRRSKGESRSRFDGVPIAYKDIFATRGVPTTAASRILEGFVPPYDATVVARCDRAGMPMLGKVNMDEFAMGSSTENSGYFPSKNPWDTSRSEEHTSELQSRQYLVCRLL